MKGQRIPAVQWHEVQANPIRAMEKLVDRINQAARDKTRAAGINLSPAELYLLGLRFEADTK